MSTTNVTAGEIMDWMASLMNDGAKSHYTYDKMLPYLNMAIDELVEEMERNNVPVTDETAGYITLKAGQLLITPVESPVLPHYPDDLMDVRQLSERLLGTTDLFTPLHRKEFLNTRPQTISLLEYAWTGQEIRFVGAVTDRELKLDYVCEQLRKIDKPQDVIGVIGARSYLAYKGASFCAKYAAEDQTRAELLQADADGCLDNILGISAKGRQVISTRRKPFRRAWKARGWI